MMNLLTTTQSLLSIVAATPMVFGKKVFTTFKDAVLNRKQQRNNKPVKLVRYDELQAYRNLNSLF